MVGAVFNGDPAPPGTGDPQLRDKGGTAFRLNGHALSFGELWYSINQGAEATGLPGTYKLGAWYELRTFRRSVIRHDGAVVGQSCEHRNSATTFNRVCRVWHHRSDNLGEAW